MRKMTIMWGLIAMAAMAAIGMPDPKDGTLVFSAATDARWVLWTCRLDGSEPKRLTDGAGGEDVDPCWAPDGNRLAFTRVVDGRSAVWIMAADGTGAESVCEGQQPSWTPDGKGLLFCRDGQVFRRELATRQEKRLSPGMWEQCAFPVMSPDQTQVLCSSQHEGVIGVYLIKLSDGSTVRLGTSKEACTPRWSPDGKKILFQTSKHICLINADGTAEEDVTFGGGVQHQAQFSPDGTRMIYVRGNNSGDPWRLWCLNLADGSEQAIPFKGSVRYPDWK